MPYVEGESLRARIAREGNLPVDEANRILREVLDGLEHAHSRGIVHRDIKPDNILLTGRHAVIADFGVAKAVGDAQTSSGANETRTATGGVAIGTPQYMAPEQAMADPAIDHRADLYSTAVVGYEMLTGRTPFANRTPQQTIAAHLTETPSPVTRARPDVPATLAHAITRGLSKEPASRWQSAGEFMAHLSSDAAPAGPGGSRLRTLAAVAAILSLAIWGGIRYWPSKSAPAAEASVVAVMPFSVTGSDRLAYLQEGIVNMLGTSFEGVAGLRSVTTHALLASAGGTVPDLARARALAARFGAGRFVVGDLVEAGGTLRISASLYAGDQDTAIAVVTEEGPDSTLFSLVDRLGARLVADAALGGDPRARLAAVTTESLPALRSYFSGERAYRAGQYAAAASAFQDAIAADGAFALAYYRLSMAQERLAWADASQKSADQALEYAGRLTQHQRAFLEAVVALRHGDTWKSDGMFRDLVATYPDDAEAWYQLGEIEFHSNPLRGRSMIEARESLRRALFYDPADLGAMYHLLRILARMRDLPALESLAKEFFALTPSGDRTLELRALQAFTTGDDKARNAILDEVALAPDNSLPLILWSVGVFAQDVPSALRVTELMRKPARPRDVQALGWLEAAHLEVARGRIDVAKAALARARELGNPDAASAERWIASLPFVSSLVPAETSSASSVPPVSRPSVFFSVHDSVQPVIDAYVRGLSAVRTGDRTGLIAAKSGLDRHSSDPSASALAKELSRGLRAAEDAAAGRSAAALAVLESADPAGWYERTFVSPFYAGARERFLRAELLSGAGRREQALGWYAGLTENSTRELVFLGPSLLRRSAILEELGRATDAIPLLDRFLELWSGADAAFAPFLAEARARRARLR